MDVNFLDLKAQYHSIKNEIDDAISQVLESSAFAAGPFVKKFEEEFAKAHGAKYCVGMNNGTAALHAIFACLGLAEGDEVIIPANTFIATPASVSLTKATPVFVDCIESTGSINIRNIEITITDKTKAIVPVHLYGNPAPMDEILEIARKYNLLVIEDACQAHLAKYKGKAVGTFGDASAFSFYPGKNLGAYGEGGACLTNSEELYKKLLAYREHGSENKYYHDFLGHNYRLEGIQGAILSVKLKYLAEWTDIRRKRAEQYKSLLSDVHQIKTFDETENSKSAYHLFVIRTKKRDELQNYLADNGIQTGIHYPIPCHLQKAYDFLDYCEEDFPASEKLSNEILSLPISEQISENEVEYVCEKIKEFYK